MASRKSAVLHKVHAREITIFKIANRKGYAAICRQHLTEGRSVPQAYARLIKSCSRKGLGLPENPPAAR